MKTAVGLQLKSLAKSYGPVEAVKSVDLTVYEGELLSLLNGQRLVVATEMTVCSREINCGLITVVTNIHLTQGVTWALQ